VSPHGSNIGRGVDCVV